MVQTYKLFYHDGDIWFFHSAQNLLWYWNVLFSEEFRLRISPTQLNTLIRLRKASHATCLTSSRPLDPPPTNLELNYNSHTHFTANLHFHIESQEIANIGDRPGIVVHPLDTLASLLRLLQLSEEKLREVFPIIRRSYAEARNANVLYYGLLLSNLLCSLESEPTNSTYVSAELPTAFGHTRIVTIRGTN